MTTHNTSIAISKKRNPNTQVGKRGRSVDKGMIELEPVIGTRDVYPDQMRRRRWLFDHFHVVAQQFGFTQYDAPIVEEQVLYQRKASEEITEQMYLLKTQDNAPLALRPEMTPSLARLFLKRQKTLILPLKWYAVPQCWRYETTTLGRKREHYQWNMDIVGVPTVAAEAELLAAMVTLFQRLGLKANDVGIKINSRAILQALLTPLLPYPSLFQPICIVIDKLDKIKNPNDAKALLKAVDSEAMTTEVVEAIWATVKTTLSLDDVASQLGTTHPAVQALRTLWVYANGYGYADWLTFDVSVVRGLAYYTGVVFEAFDRQGHLRAIAGGGRYDNLMTLYGATKNVACCGFGLGDCVIMELLKRKKLLPQLSQKLDYVVIAFNDTLRSAACLVATQLRQAGYRVDMILEKKRIGWCYKYANRVSAHFAVLIAPSEWANGMVCVKDLRQTSKQGQGLQHTMTLKALRQHDPREKKL